MPRHGILWALLLSALVVCALAGPANAAIGIFHWGASTPDNETANIQYYLNTDAIGGSIVIKNAGGTEVRTITLDSTKLTKGSLHQVTWDGADNTGQSAPTGNYTATITVNAAPITAPTTLWRVVGNNKGMAVDRNPANSTYGLVYVARTIGDASPVNKYIDIYEPDGTYVRTFKTGFDGGSATWGIAVGWSGRVYATDRSKMRLGSFDTIGGASYQGTGVSNTQGEHIWATRYNDGGVIKDSHLYFMSGSTTAATNIYKRAPINADFSFGAVQNLMAAQTEAVCGITGTWDQLGDSEIYLGWWRRVADDPGNKVQRWTYDGTTWAVDPTFNNPNPLPGNTTMKLNAVAAHPSGYLVGAYTRVTGVENIKFINVLDGSFAGINYNLPGGWSYASLTNINFDAYGNAVVNTASGGISGIAADFGMIALPDADQMLGSTDTRTTAAFAHTQGFMKPVMVSYTWTQPSIPGDNTTTTDFSGSVQDLDGASGPESITGTITVFGTAQALTVTSVDSTHWTISKTGIKAAVGQKCGVYVFPVALTDSHGKTNNVADPPQSAVLTVTGGTISGTVKLALDDDELADLKKAVTVHIHDVNVPDGSKDYDYPTNADGTFSVSVHQGTFQVSANDMSLGLQDSGYNAGPAINNVSVTNGNNTAGINPNVLPLTIYEAKGRKDGVLLAIKGIVDANRYDETNVVFGFANAFFIRDNSIGGQYDGAKIVVSAAEPTFPIEQQTVVVQGSWTVGQAGQGVRRIENVQSINTLATPASTPYGDPEVTALTGINNNPMANVDDTWSRLYKVQNVTVASVDEVNNRIVVNDGTNNATLDIFSSCGFPTGAGLTALYPVGTQINAAIGVKDRIGAWLENCLRPRKLDDIQTVSPVINYCSPVDFVKGGKWNLVSVPARPVDSNPLTVFSVIDVPNASFQFWKSQVEGGGYQSYGEMFGWTGPIERGVPYWFLEPTVTTDKQVCFDGVNPASENETMFVQTFAARTAAPFWVMVGTPYNAPINAADVRFKNINKRGDTWLTWAEAFSESAPLDRIVDSNAQGWDAANNKFTSVVPPEFIGEGNQFLPWWGYWLLVYDFNELQMQFPKPAGL